MLLLPTPPEPSSIKDRMKLLKANQPENSDAGWDTSVLWEGNRLPKYLWDYWKSDLKPLGITWQKFMRILRHRTDVGVMWYQEKLPWPDFMNRIIELIKSPIGTEAADKPPVRVSSYMPIQDLGGIQLEPPSNWQDFERLCKDVFAKVWANPMVQLNGRGGQRQAGVDVFGEIKNEKSVSGGVQCKRRDIYADDSLTVKELPEIVRDAKNFTPPLKQFIIAYTGKSDVGLQKAARLITEQHEKSGLFSVKVCSWEDLKGMLDNFPDLIIKHFPHLSSVSAKRLEEIKNAQDEGLKMQTQRHDKTDAKLDDLGSAFQNFNDLAKGGAVTAEHHAELEEIKELIDSGKYKEALDRFSTLEPRTKNSTDPIVKFRTITNKAAALAGLGEIKEAGKLFIEAFPYNPTEEKALCNKAFGYLLLDQFEEAKEACEQAIKNNPLSVRAYEIKIACSPTTMSLEEIFSSLPEPLKSETGIHFAMAQAARTRDNLPEAIKWFEIEFKNPKKKKEDPDFLARFAACLLQSIKNHALLPNGVGLSPEDKAKVERARDMLSSAIAYLDGSPTLNYKSDWLLNRSTAHKFLGDIPKSLADVDRALELKPGEPFSTKQKGFLLFDAGDTEKGIAVLKTILGNDQVPEVGFLLASILCERAKKEDFIEAKNLITSCLTNGIGTQDLQDEENRLLAHIYLNDGDFDAARKVVNKLRAANPTDIINLLIAAKIENGAGDRGAFERLLDEAVNYVTETTSPRHLFSLAEELYDAKKYAEAWPLYERLVDITRGNRFTNKLIFSYYQAEEYEKALEAAKRIPAAAKDRFTLEIEASIYESIGDMDHVIEITKEFLLSHPEDVAFRIRMAVAQLRKGETEALIDFLNTEVDIRNLSDDSALNAGKQLAFLYSESAMPMKALEVSYYLRKRFPSSPESHLVFISNFLNQKGIGDELSPKKVSLGTSVQIEEEGGEKQWYHIDRHLGLPKSIADLEPEEFIAQRLMGKKVGDEIIFDEGGVNERKNKIVDIKSKYVFAFQESMTVFSQRFPDNPAMTKFYIGDNASSEEGMKRSLDKMLGMNSSVDEWLGNIKKIYTTGQINLGGFAKLINKSIVMTWGISMNDPSLGITCCKGTLEERKDALSLLREERRVVLDISALLTCGSLERLDLIPMVFTERLITQSTIDTLSDELSDKMGQGGYMTINKEGGQYYKKEISAEQVEKQKKFLKGLKDWAIKNCAITPVRGALKLRKDHKEEIYDVLGKASSESIQLAADQGCPLYSDDAALRYIALNDSKVKSFWTQALLIYAVEKELIIPQEFEKLNISLIIQNYRHTTVTASTLLEAGRQSKWVNKHPFTSVLGTLSDPSIELSSASMVAVEFFYLLWKEPIMDSQREALVFEVLNALSQQKDKIQVLNLMSRLISFQFRLLPIAGSHLMKILTAWRSIRS